MASMGGYDVMLQFSQDVVNDIVRRQLSDPLTLNWRSPAFLPQHIIRQHLPAQVQAALNWDLPELTCEADDHMTASIRVNGGFRPPFINLNFSIKVAAKMLTPIIPTFAQVGTPGLVLNTQVPKSLAVGAPEIGYADFTKPLKFVSEVDLTKADKAVPGLLPIIQQPLLVPLGRLPLSYEIHSLRWLPPGKVPGPNTPNAPIPTTAFGVHVLSSDAAVAIGIALSNGSHDPARMANMIPPPSTAAQRQAQTIANLRQFIPFGNALRDLVDHLQTQPLVDKGTTAIRQGATKFRTGVFSAVSQVQRLLAHPQAAFAHWWLAPARANLRAVTLPIHVGATSLIDSALDRVPMPGGAQGNTTLSFSAAGMNHLIVRSIAAGELAGTVPMRPDGTAPTWRWESLRCAFQAGTVTLTGSIAIDGERVPIAATCACALAGRHRLVVRPIAGQVTSEVLRIVAYAWEATLRHLLDCRTSPRDHRLWQRFSIPGTRIALDASAIALSLDQDELTVVYAIPLSKAKPAVSVTPPKVQVMVRQLDLPMQAQPGDLVKIEMAADIITNASDAIEPYDFVWTSGLNPLPAIKRDATYMVEGHPVLARLWGLLLVAPFLLLSLGSRLVDLATQPLRDRFANIRVLTPVTLRVVDLMGRVTKVRLLARYQVPAQRQRAPQPAPPIQIVPPAPIVQPSPMPATPPPPSIMQPRPVTPRVNVPPPPPPSLIRPRPVPAVPSQMNVPPPPPPLLHKAHPTPAPVTPNSPTMPPPTRRPRPQFPARGCLWGIPAAVAVIAVACMIGSTVLAGNRPHITTVVVPPKSGNTPMPIVDPTATFTLIPTLTPTPAVTPTWAIHVYNTFVPASAKPYSTVITGSVACQSSEQLLGGGWQMYPDGTILANYPLDSSTWTAAVVLNDNRYPKQAGPPGLTVYAICLQANFFLNVHVISGPELSVDQQSTNVPCPQATLLSGGFQMQSPQLNGNGSSTALITTSAYAINNSWQVAAAYPTNSGATITTYALCAGRNVELSSPTTANITLPAGQSTPESEHCGARQWLSGGGFVAPVPYIDVTVNQPDTTDANWEFALDDHNDGNETATVSVICLTPNPTF